MPYLVSFLIGKTFLLISRNLFQSIAAFERDLGCEQTIKFAR
ncbi:hypothetical protein PPIS_a3066 [Pseudoalteromonas piscicida]|uniref:Uncharacterized protein n=1 Tax=Pseudoalteromonas piscicida TaxID=43662 RepID=A0ABM6NGQ6_PSEO7|nr:hypothetical protein PPIS_a3066 [Pseudoalteromonas piscicida]